MADRDIVRGDVGFAERWKDFTAFFARIRAAILVSSAGTEIGTASNPLRVDPTGTTGQTVAIDQTTPGTTDSVTVATGQGGGATIGATADAAVVTDTTGTLSGKLRGLVKWAFERMPAALGQTTAANSLPVVLASDHSDVPITLAGETVVLGAGSAAIGKLAANRSAAVTTLIDAEVFDDVQTAYNSAAVATDDFKHFLLFLDVDSTATPTDIQFLVQFSDDGGTTWYTYKQGLFASLFYEDQDTASGVTECFSGECAGRDFRLRAVATGTDGTNKFTVTAKVEFWA